MGISIIIGNQGAGKSCLGVIRALKYIKKGYPVYSNLPLKGAYEFNKDDLLVHEFKENAVLLFDEAATYGMGSRGNQYKKNSTDKLVTFFTMHRHYKIKEVIIISPNFADIIPAVRDNATRVTVVKRGFLTLFGLVSSRDIIRGYDIDEKSNEIKYAYKWKAFSLSWFKPSKAYAFFDSWVQEALQPKEWRKYSEIECDYVNKKVGFFKKLKSIWKGYKEIDELPTEEAVKEIAKKSNKEIILELQKGNENYGEE